MMLRWLTDRWFFIVVPLLAVAALFALTMWGVAAYPEVGPFRP